mmetsp:Transcript_40756/g.74406  ORF Transcript_40756/g.74406 Transcript_40756/m.74406 type:complete len:527 (+) Transcript_40756:52-1632(+)
MGCVNTGGGGGTSTVWNCQYCGQSFATYDQADAHEKYYCPRRPGAPPMKVQQQAPAAYGGQRNQAPAQVAAAAGQMIHIRCGNCQQVFGVPPGHAQCKCPSCGMINAVPVQQGAAGGQPTATIPTQAYNQGVGLYPAPVINQPAPAPSGRRRAFLVGINYYGTQAELRGCINDVHRMKGFISQNYGFSEMMVLTDDQSNPSLRPTRQNILRGLRWLSDGVQPGDCLFFHYSGHGAQQQDPSCSEEDGYDETICPEDFESAGMVVDDEIFDIIVAPLPHGAKLTAVMDCCHSGTGLDLPFTLNYGQWSCDDNPCHSAGDVQLISGCQDEQTSADASDQYSRPAGAMTTALCNTLERNPVVDYPTMLESLRAELRRGGFDQIPSLTSSQMFQTQGKMFSMCDGIVGNMNPQLGRQFNKKKHPKNPALLSGGLGEMLMAGAVGFMVADFAGDAMMGMMMGGADLMGPGMGYGGGYGGGYMDPGGGMMGEHQEAGMMAADYQFAGAEEMDGGGEMDGGFDFGDDDGGGDW